MSILRLLPIVFLFSTNFAKAADPTICNSRLAQLSKDVVGVTKQYVGAIPERMKEKLQKSTYEALLNQVGVVRKWTPAQTDFPASPDGAVVTNGFDHLKINLDGSLLITSLQTGFQGVVEKAMKNKTALTKGQMRDLLVQTLPNYDGSDERDTKWTATGLSFLYTTKAKAIVKVDVRDDTGVAHFQYDSKTLDNDGVLFCNPASGVSSSHDPAAAR